MSSQTKYYGQAEQVAQTIVDAFQKGNLPQALAPMFIKRRDSLPSAKWSWANQFIAIIHGCSDARAFGQWINVKRCVKKGEKVRCHILAPCTKKRTVNDPVTGKSEDRLFIYGFRTVPVFDIVQTDGEPLPDPLDQKTRDYFNNLPLKEVAESWGLTINSADGGKKRPKGWYEFKSNITLCVTNVDTWCHELVHAADDKLGNLKERGQHWRSEIVAELGSAIVLTILGAEIEADLGGCWDYIKHYARDAELDPISACMQMLKRTCDAVNLIFTTAEILNKELIDV